MTGKPLPDRIANQHLRVHVSLGNQIRRVLLDLDALPECSRSSASEGAGEGLIAEVRAGEDGEGGGEVVEGCEVEDLAGGGGEGRGRGHGVLDWVTRRVVEVWGEREGGDEEVGLGKSGNEVGEGGCSSWGLLSKVVVL